MSTVELVATDVGLSGLAAGSCANAAALLALFPTAPLAGWCGSPLIV